MIEINICIGTACHLSGSYNIVQCFQQLIEEHSLHDHIDLKAYFCMKQCGNKGVSVSVDGEVYRVEPEKAIEFFHNTVLKKFTLIRQ
jgi:NADH:ubiquinone oxidoreductase subunit E